MKIEGVFLSFYSFLVKEVVAENIVPGDILFLVTGRIISADIRLTEPINLQVEETSLAGESVPSQKAATSSGGFFAKGAGRQVLLGGFLIGTLTNLAFFWGYYEQVYSLFDKQVPENTLEYARTMAFMVLVGSQLFYS